MDSGVDSFDSWPFVCDKEKEKRVLCDDLWRHFDLPYTWRTCLKRATDCTDHEVNCTGCGTHSSHPSVFSNEMNCIWCGRANFVDEQVVHAGCDGQFSDAPAAHTNAINLQDSITPFRNLESHELSDVILRSQNAVTRNRAYGEICDFSDGESLLNTSGQCGRTLVQYSWETFAGVDCSSELHESHTWQHFQEFEPQRFADGSSLIADDSLFRVRGEDNPDLSSPQGKERNLQQGKFEPRHFVAGAFALQETCNHTVHTSPNSLNKARGTENAVFDRKQIWEMEGKDSVDIDQRDELSLAPILGATRCAGKNNEECFFVMKLRFVVLWNMHKWMLSSITLLSVVLAELCGTCMAKSRNSMILREFWVPLEVFANLIVANMTCVACDHEESEPEELQEAVHFLAQPFDPYSDDNRGSEMKADYWGHDFILGKGHSSK